MFYDNFERLCGKAKMSPSAAVLSIGLNKSAASAWKKNGTIPKEADLIELAKLLDCGIADFFVDEKRTRFGTNEESAINYFYATIPESDDEELPEDESELLRIYRECSKRQRAKLMMLAYDFEEEELG